MEYTLIQTHPVSNDDIVVVVRQWLRGTEPVCRPTDGFGLPRQPGRSPAAAPFGANSFGTGAFGARNVGGGPPLPADTPMVASSALALSPTNNLFSAHTLLWQGDMPLSAGLSLRQTGQMGGRQMHYFLVNRRDLLVVNPNSLHYQWTRVPSNWDHMLTPPIIETSTSRQPTITTPTSTRYVSGNPRNVALMSEGEKLMAALDKGLAGLPRESVNMLRGILTLEGIAMIVLIAGVVWAGGQVAALALVLIGAGAGLWNLVTRVIGLIKQYYDTAVGARTEADLDRAGRYLSEALLEGGLDVVNLFFAPSAFTRLRMLARGGIITPRVIWAFLRERYELLTRTRQAIPPRQLARQADPPPASMTNAQKGVYGEHVSDVHMANQGYVKLNDGGQLTPSTGAARGTGIDGVWRNPSPPPEYIITEAKYGSSQLGTSADGRQMSDRWILGNNRLERATGSRQEAANIARAMRRPGGVQRQLHRIDEQGNITIYELSQNADIVRRIHP